MGVYMHPNGVHTVPTLTINGDADMNRGNGATAAPNFKDFCIVIRLDDGFLCQEVVRDTSPRFALGKVFGLIKKDGLKPTDKNAVFFLKTADEMTADERWMWDVQTSNDEVAWVRKQHENKADQTMLDQF